MARMINSFLKSLRLVVALNLGAITSLSFPSGRFANANALLPSLPSPAQTTTIPQPSEAPLELSLLQPGVNGNNNVVTSNTISQQGLTVPSLWWAKEQFGGNLLGGWIAYPIDGNTPGRVDLVVERQNWSLLDYIERYEFVNSFGAVARDYGYNVRVFNYQQQLLATYTCDFTVTPYQCNMKLDSAGIDSNS